MDLAGGVIGDGSSKITGGFDIKQAEKETETQAVVDSTDGATQSIEIKTVTVPVAVTGD